LWCSRDFAWWTEDIDIELLSVQLVSEFETWRCMEYVGVSWRI